LGLVPVLPLPSVVLEIVLGIVVGPSVLAWVHFDAPVEVLSLLGLAFLLLLAGLEVEFDMLRGRLLRLTALGFALSFGIALAAGLILDAANVTGAPLLIAIMLSATSLGVVIPVLKDSGEASSPFGQFVIAAASIADVATIVCSRSSSHTSRAASAQSSSCSAASAPWSARSESPSRRRSARCGCQEHWRAFRTRRHRFACGELSFC
jgi:Kef-type K+ transport system membrane component KefB